MICGYEPEIDYAQGHVTVPAKSVEYKVDPQTGGIIREKPKTHKFENEVKADLRERIKDVSIFPTRSEVLVGIEFGIHSKRDYDACDLDNRTKTILDALKGVVYEDDRQVSLLWVHKIFLENKQESSFRIQIKLFDQQLKTSLKDKVWA